MKFKKSFIEQLIREEFLKLVREAEEEPKVQSKDQPKDKSAKTVPTDDKNPKKTVDDADPSDDELEKDVGGSEKKENELTQQLSGKQVSKVEFKEKSKSMPGFQEIVINFSGGNPPLVIFVGKSGNVKFVYSGNVYNELD